MHEIWYGKRPRATCHNYCMRGHFIIKSTSNFVQNVLENVGVAWENCEHWDHVVVVEWCVYPHYLVPLCWREVHPWGPAIHFRTITKNYHCNSARWKLPLHCDFLSLGLNLTLVFYIKSINFPPNLPQPHWKAFNTD